MRHLTALLVLTGALALSGAALASDLTLPKTTAEALKSACDKAGGKFSQGAKDYGCGTDCQGGPGTDCIVHCEAEPEMHRASDRRPAAAQRGGGADQAGAASPLSGAATACFYPQIRQRQRRRRGWLTKLPIPFDKAGEKRVVDSFVERV